MKLKKKFRKLIKRSVERIKNEGKLSRKMKTALYYAFYRPLHGDDLALKVKGVLFTTCFNAATVTSSNQINLL